jgi:hypothetical protein
MAGMKILQYLIVAMLVHTPIAFAAPDAGQPVEAIHEQPGDSPDDKRAPSGTGAPQAGDETKKEKAPEGFLPFSASKEVSKDTPVSFPSDI